MLYEKIRNIEFDLNTKCNSYCPACHRFVMQDGELYLNPWVKFNIDIELEVIERVFSNQRIVDNISVNLIGLVGDAIAHSKFMEIIDIIYKHRPNAEITIHTNGGLRNNHFFEVLAKKLNNSSSVTFSIDGLEDTNHIYRKNTHWDKIISNLTAYVNAGGPAIWKYIVFPWNRHQVDEARELAGQIGCKFRTEDERNSTEELNQLMQAADKKFHKHTPAQKRIFYNTEPRPFTSIEPRCFDNDAIYVNAHGRVVPCCMINSTLTDEQRREEMLLFMYSSNPDWNDLNIHTLEEVMTADWWEFLNSSLTTRPCSICVDACQKR